MQSERVNLRFWNTELEKEILKLCEFFRCCCLVHLWDLFLSKTLGWNYIELITLRLTQILYQANKIWVTDVRKHGENPFPPHFICLVAWFDLLCSNWLKSRIYCIGSPGLWMYTQLQIRSSFNVMFSLNCYLWNEKCFVFRYFSPTLPIYQSNAHNF